jgi:hypothetical protein
MSFVVADVVGAAGEVVGIERAPEAVAQATARARRRGLANVRFVLGDIHDALVRERVRRRRRSAGPHAVFERAGIEPALGPCVAGRQRLSRAPGPWSSENGAGVALGAF